MIATQTAVFTTVPPSAVIRLLTDYAERAIDLLEEHDAGELVRKGHPRQAEPLAGSAENLGSQAGASPEHEGHAAVAGGHPALEPRGEAFGVCLFSAHIHSDDPRVLGQGAHDIASLARDGPLSVVTGILLDHLGRLSRQPKLLDSAYVTDLLDPFRQETFASQIANRHSPQRPLSDSAPIAIRQSSSASPRELFLNMVRENRLASPAFGVLYARLGSLSPRLLLLLSAVLLVIGLGGLAVVLGLLWWRPQWRRRLAMAIVGLLALELLLFAWQVRFGSVYSGVALLVTAFMFGTVLGGIGGSRSSSIVLRPSSFLAADIALTACAGAAALLGVFFFVYLMFSFSASILGVLMALITMLGLWRDGLPTNR